MRKNLHYKVLASVLAIAGLYFYNAPAAWAEIKNPAQDIWVGNGTIDGNTVIPPDAIVYGGNSTYPNYNVNANDNELTINSSTLSKVSGGYSDSNSANNNKVTITHSTHTTIPTMISAC